ncbi:ThuA domain-containing protein [Salmonirosea aquatica]|uniref:ThuA-like domain-containing protein n=1 Tax=Salmonirosea aquatica TaxID=2654236 RepID=A0A7C9F9R1_9BACT|nr:hypothetical protein [Cytophagaceae bacterium SJW1-29]
MLRKLFKALAIVAGIALVALGGFYVYAMYLTRKLPWQHPVFDTERPADPGSIGPKGVLVFTKTNGFRHEDSILAGPAKYKEIAPKKGWDVVTTENGAFFNDDYLSRFKVVVFHCTTGDVLTPEQQAAFEKFVTQGGGYVGIHSAADTEYEWDWYDRLLGTHFRDHSIFPHTPIATVVTEIKTHPATVHLPDNFRRADEWYNYKRSVRGVAGIQVLLSLDENSYDVGETKGMGKDHPISWVNQIGQGRVFYTGMGHTAETFEEPLSLLHIVKAIEWAGKFDDASAMP